MLVLKGTEYGVEIEQSFSDKETDLAVAIGWSWLRQGLKPRLLSKSYDGKFIWLTSLIGQVKLAA